MFDFANLAELSRTHCVSLCAFLVPANLVATTLTMVLAAMQRPKLQLLPSAGMASIFALVMLWHVYTWFAIGVVMVPTYVLLWLSSTCLLANIGAIAYCYKLPTLKLKLQTYLLNSFSYIN
ncbi:hypothetical protein [Aliterella atlantica]|uniref:hypothetical protein n=1 Tax=Aliterella atlantica TaxID=1827278 RepID=UPI0005D2F7AF|nr:hypothetical protein [Aliterella atlantica]